MRMGRQKTWLLVVALVFILTTSIFSGTGRTQHSLAIMGTTDIHQYIMPWDYMADRPNENVGMSKIFTLVEEVRAYYANTLLFDTGDIIQGSLVGDYEAEVNPLTGFQFQAIIRAANVMGYDAITVGNHEVTDFGLDFFYRARRNSVFPWISANVRMANDPKDFLVDPYVILTRQIDGIPIRIGVIGFTPPQIMNWGRRHLEGLVFTQDILDQANIYIPILRNQADLVVVVSHTGVSTLPIDNPAARENPGYYLAQIEGIDALLLGHAHGRFPGELEGVEGVDSQKGLIHGVPAVLPGSWGSHLGVIHLDLCYDWDTGKWEVMDSSSKLIPVTAEVPSHPMIEAVVGIRHLETIQYVRTPIGWTDMEIASYFSRIMDNPVTQIVNEAQIWWAYREFEGSEYEGIPILSAAAPFIAGRRGATDFTHVQGDLTIGSVTDIYIYPNTIYVAKLNGAQILDWLEASGMNFTQVDPTLTTPQHFINYDFRAYNFDVIEGIEYVYDITKPAGNRVVKATYQGKPLNADMVFLVVTNNYRGSGGGNFPHVADNIILETTEINREAIIRYIQRTGTVNPAPTNNWHIMPVDMAGPLLYNSSPEGAGFVERYHILGIEFVEIDAQGWGVFEIDLSVLTEYLQAEAVAYP